MNEQELVETVSEGYQRLNEAWAKANDRMRELCLPSQVAVMVGEGEFLGWARCGCEWRICFGDRTDGEEIRWKPILESSLSVRLDMVKHFVSLRSDAVASLRCVPKLLDHAIRHLESVLSQ